ncbi:MAG: hypothetical protein CMC15_15710 [Flavobacteriaceae bacterium]|nr:hypothetical protein [Flavobacteriaceae bacterium]
MLLQHAQLGYRIAEQVLQNHEGDTVDHQQLVGHKGYLYLCHIYGNEEILWTIKTFFYLLKNLKHEKYSYTI